MYRLLGRFCRQLWIRFGPYSIFPDVRTGLTAFQVASSVNCLLRQHRLFGSCFLFLSPRGISVMTFLISFSLLPLYRLINTWAFIILLVLPASISLVYLHFNMPETRGKEVHEIVDALAYADDRKMSVKYRHKDSQNMVEIDLNDS